MKLIELMTLANKSYGDGAVAEYFDPVTGHFKPNENAGDSLASFVASELDGTFDEDASDEEQLEKAVMAMQKAVEDISHVVDRLVDEHIDAKNKSRRLGRE